MLCATCPREELERDRPEIVGKFNLLFLGRLHIKKGLDLLIEALANVSHIHPKVHLLVAGADDGALAPFTKRTAELGMADRVTLLGHVSGESAQKPGARPTRSSCRVEAKASAWRCLKRSRALCRPSSRRRVTFPNSVKPTAE